MNIFDLPVHPIAELFPMLDEEQMHGLVEDLKANGQKEAIVLGQHEGELVLVDGRNRREACRQAGINAPEYKELNGEDVNAYIISKNIHRRHLSKGQQAILWAKAYPEAKRSGRANKNSSGPELFSRARLSDARALLKEAPELAEEVFKTGEGFEAALESIRAKRPVPKLAPEKKELVDVAKEQRVAEYMMIAGAVEKLSKFQYKAQRDGFIKDMHPREFNREMRVRSLADAKKHIRVCINSLTQLLEEWK